MAGRICPASRYTGSMVRRDDAEGKPSASRCSSPAGASPASVSAGAPSSRPQARPETAVARAGCQKPLRREQVRGPQHEVKPAASTHLQPESRAAHLTAKATSPTPRSGGARAGGLGGVWGAARGHGGGRNTRGPSARPESGQRVSHKPKVKAGAAQRESEGVILPRRAVQHNAAGGKDPCGGHGVGARTREGMAGETGPNSPERRAPLDKVRQLQRRLWAAAKRSPNRRFHALMDRLWRDDVLRRRGGGSSGIVARRASILRRWPRLNSAVSMRSSRSSARRCGREGIGRNWSSGDTSPRLMAGGDRSGYRRSGTGLRRWPRRWC